MPKRTKTREPGIYAVERADGGKSYEVAYRNVEGKPRSKTFRNYNSARDFKRSSHTEVKAGTHIDPSSGKTTFAAYYADFKARQVWQPNTFRAVDVAIRQCPFADLQLSKIRRTHIDHWVKLMHQDLKPGTIRTRMVYVKMVFNGAVRDQIIGRNPLEGVPMPKMSMGEELPIPDPSEVNAILKASHPHWRALWAVCAFGGLRAAEAAALQVDDIRFLKREIRVDRQAQREPGGVVDIRPPKYGSQRTIYVPDALMSLLAEHIKSGTNGKWLFMGSRGQPPMYGKVNWWWGETQKAAKVGPYRLHDMRHFFASGLIAAGTDPVTVQRQLGHKSAKVTLDTYSHLWHTSQDVTRAAVGALMDESLGDDVGKMLGKAAT